MALFRALTNQSGTGTEIQNTNFLGGGGGVLISGADKRFGATDAGTVYLAPFTDAVTAVQVRRANNTTAILSVDTTNSRVGVNTTTPTVDFDVGGNGRFTGNFVANGNGTIGGALDSATMSVDTGANSAYYQFAAGQVAAVSAANQARLRYNNVSKTLQVSLDTAAYVDLSTGGGGGGGWQDDGTVVRLIAITDQVCIGDTTMLDGEALRVTAAGGHSGVVIEGKLIQSGSFFNLLGSSNSDLATIAGAKLDIASGAASTWKTFNLGTLTIEAGSTLIMGTGTTTGVSVGQAGITTTVTGGLTQLTGAVSLTATGASSFTATGALTLTSGGTATWSSSSGNLNLDAAAALNLGTTTATSTTLGRLAVATNVAGSTITIGTTSAQIVNFTGTVGAAGVPNINFVKEVNHTLLVVTSTTAGANGGDFTITAGQGATNGGGSGGIGGTAALFAGNGAAATGANTAGQGGATLVNGGEGGAGTATGSAAAGGTIGISAGGAGADNGGGGALGGSVNIDAGLGSAGAASNGNVRVGPGGNTKGFLVFSPTTVQADSATAFVVQSSTPIAYITVDTLGPLISFTSADVLIPDQQILAKNDATSALPSYSFDGDPNNGWYRDKPDGQRWAINSNDVMILDASSWAVGVTATASLVMGGTEMLRTDTNTAASETGLLLSVAGAVVSRVSVGANDSGGTGFRLLRVPN